MQDGRDMGKGGRSETGETVAAIISVEVENGERERGLREKEVKSQDLATVGLRERVGRRQG